jgi:hypothetical protein
MYIFFADPQKVGFLGRMLKEVASHPYVKDDAYIAIHTTVTNINDIKAHYEAASLHHKHVRSCISMKYYNIY